jgi:hypothetical protein
VPAQPGLNFLSDMGCSWRLCTRWFISLTEMMLRIDKPASKYYIDMRIRMV